MHSIKKQWFSVAIVSSILVAYLFTKSGVIFADTTSTKIKFTLIILIFILSGLTIETQRLRQSLRKWQMHIFIQLVSFVGFPLFVFTSTFLFMPYLLSSPVYIGFIVLACIPTTITSCVVFTRAAGGNAEASLFNATLGNIIGIIVTPLLIYLLLSQNIQMDLLEAIKKLSVLVILPFLTGQIIRNRLKLKVDSASTRSVNNLMVLGIILLAFIKTFQQGIEFEIEQLVYILASCLVIKGISTFFCWYISGLLDSIFTLADQICITLTATPKTLAMGLPLVAILFADNPNLAVISLPMICYYTIQLLIDSFLIGLMVQMQLQDSKHN